MRKINFLVAVICLPFAFSSFGSTGQSPENHPDPWSISEPVLFVRLDAERGYHVRVKGGPTHKAGGWIFSKAGQFQNTLIERFGGGRRRIPVGKAVLLNLPGPFTVLYFASNHSGQPTMVAIEVPGRADLATINSIATESFSEIWKSLDTSFDLVEVEGLIEEQKSASPTCHKSLSECSDDDLICELKRRGWNVNLSRRK